MTAPWLSVVIPTHNGQRWLADTLQSLVDQDNREFECIIVDSSTGSATLEIAQRFSSRLTISAHRRTDLLAWTAKTNFAVSIARADHVCMLHQDDLWRPTRSSWLRRWIDASPGGVLYLHSSLIIDGRSRVLGTWHCPLPIQSHPVPSGLLLERLLVQNFVAIPAPTFRREAFLRLGGMDVPLWYTADWDLYMRLAADGPVYYRGDPMTCFRIHADSLTMQGSRSAADFRDQLQIVVDRYAHCLPARRFNPAMKLARASLEVNVALACAQNGNPSNLFAAMLRVIALGPVGMARYFRTSRVLERVMPRVRARLAGGL